MRYQALWVALVGLCTTLRPVPAGIVPPEND